MLFAGTWQVEQHTWGEFSGGPGSGVYKSRTTAARRGSGSTAGMPQSAGRQDRRRDRAVESAAHVRAHSDGGPGLALAIGRRRHDVEGRELGSIAHRPRGLLHPHGGQSAEPGRRVHREQQIPPVERRRRDVQRSRRRWGSRASSAGCGWGGWCSGWRTRWRGWREALEQPVRARLVLPGAPSGRRRRRRIRRWRRRELRRLPRHLDRSEGSRALRADRRRRREHRDRRRAARSACRCRTAQMYHVAIDNRVPYWIYSNRQDDGTMRGPSTVTADLGNGRLPDTDAGGGRRRWPRRARRRRRWRRTAAAVAAARRGSRTSAAASPASRFPIRPTPNIVWASCYGNKVTRWDARTGTARSVEPWMITLDSTPNKSKYRCHWTSPIAIDPFEHNSVYYGCQVMFKTTNGGQSWTEISPDLSHEGSVEASSRTAASSATTSASSRRGRLRDHAVADVRKA